MKKLYVLFFLCSFCGAFAQIVTFPDPKFKAKLLSSSQTSQIAYDDQSQMIAIDANGDGEIDVSETQAVRTLNLYGSFIDPEVQIHDLTGITAFTNLRFLECSHNALTSIDLSGLVELETLQAIGNDFSMINLSGLPMLKNVSADGSPLLSMAAVNLTGAVSIEHLRFSSCQFTEADFTMFPSLKQLTLDNNEITSLNVAGLQNLEKINIQNNPITNIDLTLVSGFKYLNANGSSLTALDVSQNPLLTHLYLSENQIAALDLSHNPLFFYLDIRNNDLHQLFIKNGHADTIQLSNNPNLTYICADEVELSNGMLYDNDATQVNTYCSFVPGGNYYTISGSNSFDVNADGCESTDLTIPNMRFDISSGANTGTVIANASGNFSIPVLSGTHTLIPSFENSEHFVIDPSPLSVSFPDMPTPFDQHFCVTAGDVFPDVEIVIIPMNLAQPGFDCHYKLLLKNKGNQTQSGTATFSFEDGVMDFVSSDPAPDAIAVGLLSWNFSDLHSFQTKEFHIVLTANSPLDTPPLQDGDVLSFSAAVDSGADSFPEDNEFVLQQTLLNSLDPNDKTCLEGSITGAEIIGKYVHYLIRFENTGTANARNIVVRDDIDADKYDIGSLIPLSSSHDFQIRINGNRAEFIFENIQLPFDDANNDGYVAFKIRTKPTLQVGDTFSNSAAIYFDYNFPIITEPASTTIQELSTIERAFSGKLLVYPNPTSESLKISSDTVVEAVEVYSLTGYLLQTIKRPASVIDVSSLASGTYFLKAISNQQISVSKFIKN